MKEKELAAKTLNIFMDSFSKAHRELIWGKALLNWHL